MNYSHLILSPLGPNPTQEQIDAACIETEEYLRNYFVLLHIPVEHVNAMHSLKRDALMCAQLGFIPSTMQVRLDGVVIDKAGIPANVLETYHPKVVSNFNKYHDAMTHPFYVFTRNEPWWQAEPFFFVHDSESLLQYALYETSTTSQEVRDCNGRKSARGRGRPRNEAAHAAKADKAVRYQQWLADCEAYKQQVTNLTDQYRIASLEASVQIAQIEREKMELVRAIKTELHRKRSELSTLKLQGSPRWIP